MTMPKGLMMDVKELQHQTSIPMRSNALLGRRHNCAVQLQAVSRSGASVLVWRLRRAEKLLPCAAGLSNTITALTGAGLTGSYIFSQTIFSMRAGVHTRLHGAIIAGESSPPASPPFNPVFLSHVHHAVSPQSSFSPQSSCMADVASYPCLHALADWQGYGLWNFVSDQHMHSRPSYGRWIGGSSQGGRKRWVLSLVSAQR